MQRMRELIEIPICMSRTVRHRLMGIFGLNLPSWVVRDIPGGLLENAVSVYKLDDLLTRILIYANVEILMNKDIAPNKPKKSSV